ncbi:MAG TPA: beta-ketoacyl synthase N-terminal-like domain-containing protein, partial [Steroidobacteraceae bacterium]|nr:beta-ketoacyl synthase N-terminal-like domain-containing protein [Steroidobacteraceae bacterium]
MSRHRWVLMHRVVVTGMGGICALGSAWREVRSRLAGAANAVRRMPEWDCYVDLNSLLAAPVEGFEVPGHWTRRQTRGMGRVSQFAVFAAERALTDAGLLGDPLLRGGTVGVACGSAT